MIYENTKTPELINTNPEFVLQLLAVEQYRLVDLLGKKSGHQVEKIRRLEKRNLITGWNGFKILTGAPLAVIQLQVINTMEGGDHKIFLCDVMFYKNLQEGKALSLNDLRKHRLVRM